MILFYLVYSNRGDEFWFFIRIELIVFFLNFGGNYFYNYIFFLLVVVENRMSLFFRFRECIMIVSYLFYGKFEKDIDIILVLSC